MARAETMWTAAAVQTLIDAWAEGKTSVQIAELLGCTKNQVIGKAHRLQLPARPNPVQRTYDTGKPRRPANAIQKPQNKPIRETLNALGVAIYRPRLPPSARLPVPVGLHPPHRRCQFAINDCRPWRFCDAPSVTGYSWCAEHKAIVFRPMSEAREYA